jgi:hypothetical protein
MVCIMALWSTPISPLIDFQDMHLRDKFQHHLTLSKEKKIIDEKCLLVIKSAYAHAVKGFQIFLL